MVMPGWVLLLAGCTVRADLLPESHGIGIAADSAAARGSCSLLQASASNKARRAGRAAGDAGRARGVGHGDYWPHARGQVGAYSSTHFVAPPNLSEALAWSWHHPDGRYHTVIVGAPLLDGDRNIYLATEDGIRKFSPDGQTLWYYQGPSDLVGCPSLMDGVLYGHSHDGHVFALDMQTGKELWLVRHAQKIGGDTAYVETHDGVLVTGMEASPVEGNTKVIGVNTSDGSLLWEFKVVLPVWNIMAMFPGDDTAIFMDMTGGVYRVGLHNGTLFWHTPAPVSSFSDGGVILGPDGSAYTCSNVLGFGVEGEKGALRKYRLSDGGRLWERRLEYPCNSWPAVTADGRDVVVPMGGFLTGFLDTSNSGFGARGEALRAWRKRMLQQGEKQRAALGRSDVHGAIAAFDAETGAPRWRHELRQYGKLAVEGDEEGLLVRMDLGIRPMCLPAQFSAPTIDGTGAVLVGRATGELISVTGGTQGTSERLFHTGAGALHPGTSFAPGMMAFADCDTLHVFKY